MENVRIVNPVSQVNENVVRIVAFFVLALAIATIATGWVILPVYLSIDFFLRAFTSVKPPFALLAQLIARSLQLGVKPIYAPPKKFAAAVGFVFSVTISALLLGGLTIPAYAVAGILSLFAALESFLSICAGCYVYSWIVAPLLEKFKG
jgi:hypothetical protein